MSKKKISQTVILLSLVSLFNDISSEMLIPILPFYLKSIGYTALFIGILEGFAEATSGLSKAYFGKFSDNLKNRMSFVRLGYGMSAIGKSMLAVFTFPIWVFASRSLDRLGKGVRTGARDALLADESTPENRGKIFGFNKALDTIGAGLGVLAALVYLHFYPSDYSRLFFIAFLPALVAVGITWLVKEKKQTAISNKKAQSLGYWKMASADYKKLLFGLLLFALFNSSDAFILLMGKQAQLTDTTILSAYIFYNMVFALLAYPFGHLADKLGMKGAFLIGVLFFMLAYFLFPLCSTVWLFFLAFFVYGFYAAATDGVSKAWLSKHCNPDDKATALGFYSGMQSIVILTANILAGLIWTKFSPQALFYLSVAGALVVVVYFLFQMKEEKN